MKPTLSLSRHQPGFTMVELIVTMIVIGILAVAVLPRLDLLKGFDEAGYRDKVKATLEYARKSAVAQRRYSCVTRSGDNLALTIDQNIPESYVIGTCPTSLLSLPATDRSCDSPVPNGICAPNGVTLEGTTTLIFSPLGSTAGGSYTIKVGANTSATITVEAETGYVHH